MTFLDLYLHGIHDAHHPECSFALNRQLRAEKDLPDFSRYSLNHTWPRHRGVKDNPYRSKCAIPE